MTRHQKTKTAVVGLVGLLMLSGLGARQEDALDHEGRCKDIDEILEYATYECEFWKMPEEFREAYIASKVQCFCPEYVTCTSTDSVWCAPCTDKHGAAFWGKLDGASARCNTRYGWDHKYVDEVAYDACFVADVEQQCPGLAGTDWFTWLSTFRLDKPKE